MNIGQRLKHARKVRGMTQDVLAEKIGASRGVITNIEGGKIADPQEIVVKAICNALDISQSWLVSGTGAMDVSDEEARSAKILSDIEYYVQSMSDDERLFILDMIQTYLKRLKKD